ncbi:choice-of-anchor D domain-containing protein [Natrinema sp. 1APR25-10V2]|uniref:choice-of-anchor D domain-containing protein n=1 Tax=Natrinema sp. 1APR25-10V2 TaxID=2951081 RepID=UPI002874047E|nr:choice-of-anchor D domain-containing protein [Natrinema sp. 1APR25-10V2]MDS0473437.1 choice-of-anchor D domain-containing protein [Natrinema sp. 1APR25-10V2]
MVSIAGREPRLLLLCFTVLSVTAAPASAVVWPTGGANGYDSRSPPTGVARDHPDDAGGTLSDGLGERVTIERPETRRRAERDAFATQQSHDFGRVTVGSNATQAFRVTTGETAPVTDLAIVGEDSEAFRITDVSETTSAPGTSRRIAVTFAPESDGPHLATLRLERADGPPIMFDLAGTGVAPDIDVRPETLQFANVTDEQATETLTITNNGTAPLTLQALRIVGPDSRVFESAVSGPLRIEPNQSRSVTVTFDQTEPRPRFATMHVLSDDPDEPQRNVWLTNTEIVADVSPSTVLADRTIVNATIENARANTSQSINISWPLTRDDPMAIDSFTFTPRQSGDFSINVTKSDDQFEGDPPFDLADGTEDVAFVSMNSTIADEDLRNVTINFRVRRDQLAGNETGPDDVSLYTRSDGNWIELPTELVGAGRTHYFFEAESPGLLDFATGIQQAKFRIDDAVVRVTEIRVGESTNVVVRVTNVGSADGTYTVGLIRDDTVVDRRELSIAPSGSRQAFFTQSFADPGTYEMYVNDHFVGTVTVVSAEGR